MSDTYVLQLLDKGNPASFVILNDAENFISDKTIILLLNDTCLYSASIFTHSFDLS